MIGFGRAIGNIVQLLVDDSCLLGCANFYINRSFARALLRSHFFTPVPQWYAVGRCQVPEEVIALLSNAYVAQGRLLILLRLFRKVKSGSLEVHPSQPALLVNYELHAQLLRPSGDPLHHDKKVSTNTNTQYIKAKILQNYTFVGVAKSYQAHRS